MVKRDNIHGISDTYNQRLHSDLVRSKHHRLVPQENPRPDIQDLLNTIQFFRNLNSEIIFVIVKYF